MILYLNLQYVMAMHRVLIERYGGLDGFRDPGLLESALAQSQQSVFGEDLFPNIPSRAAAYAYYLSENQPFIDGNKRIATASAITFLRLNHYDLKASQEEVYQVIMELANKRPSRESFVDWFLKYSIKKQKKIKEELTSYR